MEGVELEAEGKVEGETNGHAAINLVGLLEKPSKDRVVQLRFHKSQLICLNNDKTLDIFEVHSAEKVAKKQRRRRRRAKEKEKEKETEVEVAELEPSDEVSDSLAAHSRPPLPHFPTFFFFLLPVA